MLELILKNDISFLKAYYEYYDKQKNDVDYAIKELYNNNSCFHEVKFLIKDFIIKLDLKITSNAEKLMKRAFLDNEVVVQNCSKNQSHHVTFNAAHLLGHYLLHINDTDKILYCNINENKLMKEKEANEFANRLIMPNKFLMKIYYVLKETYSLKTLSELLDILVLMFDVPKDVILYNLKKLKLI